MGTLIIARHSITEASAAGRNLGQRSGIVYIRQQQGLPIAGLGALHKLLTQLLPV